MYVTRNYTTPKENTPPVTHSTSDILLTCLTTVPVPMNGETRTEPLGYGFGSGF